MIVSRPLRSTLFSFVLFQLITIVVIFMNVWALARDPMPAWYNYLVVILLTPIGLFVFYKIFLRYKVLRLGNNTIEIEFPVLRQQKAYPLEQIESWMEHEVKTGKTSTYKEIEIQFTDGEKISVGQREHTEYAKMVQYLAQKAGKKKRLQP